MNFNNIVEVEAARGRAIFSTVKANGGTVTAEMRVALSRLNRMARDSSAGEEMDQSDAALAVNLADQLAEHSERYQNGKVWALAVRAYELLGGLGRVKVMLLGIVCMFAVFSLPWTFNLAGSISLQIAVVVGSLVLLGVHSLMCAGSLIGREKVGLVREFLATLFMLTPVFAAIMVFDASTTPRLTPGGSTYSAMYVSFFFMQGVVALVLGYMMPNTFGENDPSESYASVPMLDDDFLNPNPMALDPEYGPTGMGMISSSGES